MKKLLAIVMALVMCLSLLPVSALAAYEVNSGDCGNHLTWTLDSDGTLTISGTGNMYNYKYDELNAPWHDYNRNIVAVVIDSGVTSIGDNAFYSCYNLRSISIPNSVISIGDSAFSVCFSLKSITLPDSISSIGDDVFFRCDCLESISVSANNNNYCSADGVLFNKDRTELIRLPAAKADASYSVPGSVSTIAGSAFSGCFNLKNITLPNSVINIGDSAFSLCFSLKSIMLPDSISSIGDDVFFAVTASRVYLFQQTTTIIAQPTVFCSIKARQN